MNKETIAHLDGLDSLELNKFVAEEIKGWENICGTMWNKRVNDDLSDFMGATEDFTPSTDIGQAMELLEEWCNEEPQSREANIQIKSSDYGVCLDDDCELGAFFKSSNKDLCRAIIYALLEAKGYEVK